ncbi:MAG: carbamoyl-phosphate synthase large subunit [Thermaerobacter sp.]|nr:carbamoyl-phosphate synthase large subunit [Thermaerobacter sp.]
MPPRSLPKKVLVIGSGPIVIGQAAEFDYAGTQACQSLREEGIEVVLVNSNPATIMTDPGIADRVYLEPLLPEYIEKVIEKELPDGLLPTLGGQVGLNLAVQLAEQGVLERYGVRVLGTPIAAIREAEDREAFRGLMLRLGEPIPQSQTVSTLEEGRDFARRIGFPLIVRPAYTLGGTGGGIALDAEQFEGVLSRGLALSPIRQCLVEQSIAGWKEVEYEVMRDSADQAITVCNMENIDPVGVHTGDSIVVAPSLTLTDPDYQMLRSASLRIIRALGVEGGCNVQFGLHPETGEYRVIEVNPRVSRSSALASKATGYPIAKLAAKLALGFTLDELRNPVTGRTTALFEPALDYVVVKIPRWPFDKFAQADRRLGTQMQATGEVMAIGRTLRAAILKAARSLEVGANHLHLPSLSEATIDALLALAKEPDDRRIFALAEALRRGTSIETLHDTTQIDLHFLREMERIVQLEKELQQAPGDIGLLRRAKRDGFSDRTIGELWHQSEDDVRRARQDAGIVPTYKMVDTCAAEFDAQTPYYYGAYEFEDEAPVPKNERSVLVLGAGPIRIGQGIEFDCSAVHALQALRAAGRRALMLNSNPETVSTDWTQSDRLYFEPLSFEDVREVAEREQIEGALVQFGGQTAINLAARLAEAGVPILGTSIAGIDKAEDRRLFDAVLEEAGLRRPRGRTVLHPDEALRVAEEIGYPVLVRPSFVLGGRAMEIVYNAEDLAGYLERAVSAMPGRPILVDQYLPGLELEVDAVADGEDVLVGGIMEHIERAGVHSGDSIAVYPAQSIDQALEEQVVDATVRLARALDTKGLLNVQFVAYEGDLYVIEANPRASRTLPYLMKVANVPLAAIATNVALGTSLRAQGIAPGLWPKPGHVGVKCPVFSWAKLRQVDATLGPEMKSTGEVLGIDESFSAALLKAFEGAGYQVPQQGRILLTIADRDKEEVLPLARDLYAQGARILATAGTAEALRAAGVAVEEVPKIGEGHPDLLDRLRAGDINLVVNTFTQGRSPLRDGFQIRRTAVEHGIPCVTSLDTARAILRVMAAPRKVEVRALQDYFPQGASR